MEGTGLMLARLRIDEYRLEAERVHRVSQALREREELRQARALPTVRWRRLSALAAAASHLVR